MFSTLQDVRLALTEVATSNDVPQNVKDRLQGIISQLPTVDLSMQISELNLKLDSLTNVDGSDIAAKVVDALGFDAEETLADSLSKTNSAIADVSNAVSELQVNTQHQIGVLQGDIDRAAGGVNQATSELGIELSRDLAAIKNDTGKILASTGEIESVEASTIRTMLKGLDLKLSNQGELISSGDSGVNAAISSLLAIVNASNSAISKQIGDMADDLESDTASLSTLVRTCTNTVKSSSLEEKEALAQVEKTFAEKLEDGSQRIISASGVKFAEAYAIVEDRIIGLTTLLSASSARLLEEFASEGQNVGQYKALVTSIKPSLDSMREALDQAKDFMEASKTFVSFMSDVLLVSQLVDGLQSMWKQMDQSVRDQSKNFSAVLSSLTEERNKVLGLVKDLTSSVKTLNTIDTAVNVGRLVKETTTEIIDRTKPAPEAEVY
jgi:hypothetical protein